MGFIEITAKRSAGGNGHEHIVSLRTVDKAGHVRDTTPERLVQWLETATNVAVVYTPSRAKRFIVGPYRAADGTRCVRAYTQNGWEDHLLLLPEIEAAATGRETGDEDADPPPEGALRSLRRPRLVA